MSTNSKLFPNWVTSQRKESVNVACTDLQSESQADTFIAGSNNAISLNS